MADFFHEQKTLYPPLCICVVLVTLIGALAMARSSFGIVFLVGVYVLVFLYGYRGTCIKMFPVMVIYCAVVYGLFYLASGGNAAFATQMTIRLAGVVVAALPGLAMQPVKLVRALTQMKCPRLLTLGMLITTSFVPVLGKEMRQIRGAMKTRGVTGFWNLNTLYRAFLIPLIARLVNISDTLALSVETRGFISDSGEYTVYHLVKTETADVIFTVAYVALLAVCIAGMAVM